MSENRYAPPAAKLSDSPEAELAGPSPDGKVRRFFAVMLMLGGAGGVAIFVWMFLKFFAQGAATLAVLSLLLALFVWAIYVGWRLWHGTPSGRRWGVIVFATQIPVITIAGFQCHWFTGIQVAPILSVQGGSFNLNFALNAGANGTLYFGPGGGGIELGVNLFALIAVIALMRGNRRAPS